MENLTPPLLVAVRELRWSISNGNAMKEALQSYLDGAHDALALELRRQLIRKMQGALRLKFSSYREQALWDLIERGMAGQPTLEALQALEAEVEQAAQSEIDAHLAELPFRVLIPLILFQFPAYLLLLLGPMLRSLSQQMGS